MYQPHQYLDTLYPIKKIEKRRIDNILGHGGFVKTQEIPVLAPLSLTLSPSKFVNPLSLTLINFV